jgi:hypothetical protein
MEEIIKTNPLHNQDSQLKKVITILLKQQSANTRA